jgi:hypothetical protein
MGDMEKRARELLRRIIGHTESLYFVRAISEALEQAYREGQREPDWEYLRSKSPISSIVGHIGAEYLRDVRAEERERCAKVAEAKGRTTDPAFPVFAMEAVAAAIRELE